MVRPPITGITQSFVDSTSTRVGPISSKRVRGNRGLRMSTVPYAIDLILQTPTQDILDAYRDAYVIPRSIRIRPIALGEYLSSPPFRLTVFNLDILRLGLRLPLQPFVRKSFISMGLPRHK